MDEAQRWSVTYTKHVKQKRKVYHDGFLLIQPSCNKVMLYDEWDKLLETRFMKKDDLILSGETITFGSYLVDLGELCQGHQPTSVLSSQNQDNKVSETSNSFHSYTSQNKKPTIGKRRGRGLDISPSQKMIRDFKKSEMSKVGCSPSCMDMTKLSTKEWQVLYTTQITQKTKKFHDGFLQLIFCGSQGRQVKLYDTNRILDGRFLKRDENVSSGESLSLDGHLVEIGELEDHKPPADSNVQGRSCTVAGKSDMVNYQPKIPINKKFTAGKTPGDISQGTLTKLSESSYQNENAKLSWGDAEPRRSVYNILSILKPPSERKDISVSKPFSEDCTNSHSTESHSDTTIHIKDYAEESSATARKELREKGSEHDSMMKVVKIEPFDKVIIDVDERAVSENGRVPQARFSSFQPRPEAMNFMSSTRDVQCINLTKFESSSSSVKYFQKDKEFESLTRSYKKRELENSSIIYSCEEAAATDSNAALSNVSSFCKLPEVQEGKKRISCRGNDDCTSGLNKRSLKEDLDKQDMDDFPSFDLGIF